MATNDIYDVKVLKVTDRLMDRFLEAREKTSENPKELELTAQEMKTIKNLLYYNEGVWTFVGVPIKIVDKV